MLRDSVVVVVVRTRPRAIPLAMIAIRKILHGFPFLSRDAYGAPLGGPLGRRSSAINELVGQPLTQIKTLVLNPNQRTETKSNFSDESKSLNIVRKKWHTVANTVFRHPEVKSKLLVCIPRREI